MKKAVLIALAATALVSACGHRGSLQRPPPLWGEDQRTAGERAHETQEGDDSEQSDE